MYVQMAGIILFRTRAFGAMAHDKTLFPLLLAACKLNRGPCWVEPVAQHSLVCTHNNMLVFNNFENVKREQNQLQAYIMHYKMLNN